MCRRNSFPCPSGGVIEWYIIFFVGPTSYINDIYCIMVAGCGTSCGWKSFSVSTWLAWRRDVDDMRSDPYPPPDSSLSETKIDARVRHVQFKKRALPTSLDRRTRTEWRTLGRVSQRVPYSLLSFFLLGGERELYDQVKSAPNDFLSGDRQGDRESYREGSF